MIRINLARRGERRQRPRRRFRLDVRAEDRARLQPDPARSRRPSSAGATGRSASDAAQVERDIAAAQREEQRLVQVISEVREFEAQRERSCSSASRSSSSCAAARRRRCTCSTRSAAALPDMLWLTQADADRLRRHDRGQLPDAHRAVGLRRQPRALGLLHPAGRDREQRGRGRRRRPAPELIKFTVKAAFQMSGLQAAGAGRAAPAGRGAGREGRRPWLACR